MGGAGLGYRQIIIKQFSRTRLQGQTLYANKLFVGTNKGVIISPILFLEPMYHMIRPNVCGTDEHTGYPLCVEMLLLRPHNVQTLHHSTSTSTSTCSRIWKLDCDDSLITLHYDEAETGTNNIWHLMDAFRKLGLLPWCEACLCLVTGAVVPMVSSDHWPVWLPLRPVPAVQLSYRNYFHIFCQAYTTLGGFINA